MKKLLLSSLMLCLSHTTVSFSDTRPANSAMTQVNQYCDYYSKSQLNLFKCKAKYMSAWPVLNAFKPNIIPSIKPILDSKFNEFDQTYISMLIGTYCEQENSTSATYCYQNNAKYFMEYNFTINNNPNVSKDILPICAANAAGRDKPYDYINHCMQKLYRLE